MESSVRATQRLGDDRAQEMLHVHNTIVRRALDLNGGREVKHTGDGIMATFTSARRAVASAITIQAASAEYNDAYPERAFSIRVGLNAGEPVSEDNDVFGTAVQLAARVCARAEPGKILASDVVRQLVAGKGLLFADIGPAELKGFAEAIHLYEIRSEAGAGIEALNERAGLARVFRASPARVLAGAAAVTVILVAGAAAALLATGDNGGKPPAGLSDVGASSASPTPSSSPAAPTSTSSLLLSASDAEDIRDLIDRYNAKKIEALRSRNLAGLDAIAIGDAFTLLARAVDDLNAKGVQVESTRESIDVDDPVSAGSDAASAETIATWTNCSYRRGSNELTDAQRSSYQEIYHVIRSSGRWYIERVEVTVLSQQQFDGCEACKALRSGCEAIVRNVAPLNLFVRAAPSRTAQVKGRLPDETAVCLTGTFEVADNLTWWPVRATITSGVVEGWSADHEPEPPGAALLESTGRRCE